MSDLISRQAAIDAIMGEPADAHYPIWYAERLEQLPAEQPEQRWIPCSERQPQKNGNYLAFYHTSDGTASLEFMMVDHCNAGGDWLHEENGRKAYKKVISWMPLPEPYKAE